MYTQEQIITALKTYHQYESVTKTICVLGYPIRRALYTWIKDEGSQKSPRKDLCNINTRNHPRNPSLEVKMNAIHRCFELGESIKLVSEGIGYTRASIYTWRKRYLQGGTIALMNDKNIKPGTLTEGTTSLSTPDMEQIQAQMKDMQLEIDVLKETINVLKKDPGIDQTALKNREKAVIVDALKDRYSLQILLKLLNFSRSSYYYQKAVFQQKDKYDNICKNIVAFFNENMRCYGYRRIHGLLKREGITISEKIVRRIMQEEDLVIKTRKRKKYNSYQGEISPSVPNLIQRDFHANKPNEKWLTDITEFAIPTGKIYLSSIVDCFDGMLPCWTIGIAPDSSLVNRMLDQAISQLNKNE